MGRDINDAVNELGMSVIGDSIREQVKRAPKPTPKREPVLDIRDAKPTPSAVEIVSMLCETSNAEKQKQLMARRIMITDQIAIPQIELIGGLFPRGYITFVAAQQGNYKSWFTEKLAADLSAGGNIFGGFICNEPIRKVLFFTGESRWTQFARRSKQMGWNISSIVIYDRWEMEKNGTPLELDTDAGKSNVETIVAAEKPDVAFIDSMFDFHNSDENKADNMKPVMAFLNGIAEKHNADFVLSHHNRKLKTSEQKYDLTQDEMIGSSMLHKNAAVILMLQKKTITDSYGTVVEDAVVVRCEKSWVKKPARFAFRIEDEDDKYHTSMRIVLNPDTGGTRKESVVEVIEASFAVGEWFKSRDVMKLCGNSVVKRTIERVLEEMKADGRIITNGKETSKVEYSRTK
jgi:hypothetical protein